MRPCVYCDRPTNVTAGDVVVCPAVACIEKAAAAAYMMSAVAPSEAAIRADERAKVVREIVAWMDDLASRYQHEQFAETSEAIGAASEHINLKWNAPKPSMCPDCRAVEGGCVCREGIVSGKLISATPLVRAPNPEGE